VKIMKKFAKKVNNIYSLYNQQIQYMSLYDNWKKLRLT
jgi:hypothetical protein